MKNDKNTGLSPVLCGLIGGAAVPAAALLGMLLTAAAFMGTEDPNSYVLLSACVALAVGGAAGGFLSVKLGGAMISSVISAVTALVIMAAVSVFTPESTGVLARVLPPMVLALSPLLGGYLGMGKKQTRADAVKKAARKIKK